MIDLGLRVQHVAIEMTFEKVNNYRKRKSFCAKKNVFCNFVL